MGRGDTILDAARIIRQAGLLLEELLKRGVAPELKGRTIKMREELDRAARIAAREGDWRKADL